MHTSRSPGKLPPVTHTRSNMTNLTNVINVINLINVINVSRLTHLIKPDDPYASGGLAALDTPATRRHPSGVQHSPDRT